MVLTLPVLRERQLYWLSRDILRAPLLPIDAFDQVGACLGRPVEEFLLGTDNVVHDFIGYKLSIEFRLLIIKTKA